MTGTELWQRTMEHDAKYGRFGGILGDVWGGHPWMVTAYTGSVSDEEDRAIREWCLQQFGPEADPLRGKEGQWIRGNATIHGWTWFGFREKHDMDHFCEFWEVAA